MKWTSLAEQAISVTHRQAFEQSCIFIRKCPMKNFQLIKMVVSHNDFLNIDSKFYSTIYFYFLAKNCNLRYRFHFDHENDGCIVCHILFIKMCDIFYRTRGCQNDLFCASFRAAKLGRAAWHIRKWVLFCIDCIQSLYITSVSWELLITFLAK